MTKEDAENMFSEPKHLNNGFTKKMNGVKHFLTLFILSVQNNFVILPHKRKRERYGTRRTN